LSLHKDVNKHFLSARLHKMKIRAEAVECYVYTQTVAVSYVVILCCSCLYFNENLGVLVLPFCFLMEVLQFEAESLAIVQTTESTIGKRLELKVLSNTKGSI